MSASEINLDELSLLLKYSSGITRQTKRGYYRRAYPSAGARYPIETYLLLIRPGEGLKPGFFHYNVRNHQLEILWPKKITEKELEQMAVYDFVKEASAIIFLTAVFWRTQNKYRQRGYRFVLIEAGHIGQNIHLISEALNLKCCALGGFRISDEQIERLLRIDGVVESLIYTLAIGR